MMSLSFYVSVVALSTLLLGACAHAVIHPWLRKQGVLDVPNHRSSHSAPTVRGGGLGVTVAMVGGLTGGGLLLHLDGSEPLWVIWFGATAVAFAALGWVEDSQGLTVRTRLGAQTLIAGAAAMCALPLGGLPIWVGVLAALCGVFYVNAANFMDGINGISAWHGVVVGAFFAVIGRVQDSPGLLVAGVVAAAAFMSFLPWNSPRASMFLGDVGSYTLGAVAWGLCLIAIATGTRPHIAVAPLLIFISDVLFTLVKRAHRRAPLHQAHREHRYQQVQQITGSHGLSTSLATAATAVCAGLGLWSLHSPDVQGWAGLLIVSIVVMYLAAPTLLSLWLMDAARTEADA